MSDIPGIKLCVACKNVLHEDARLCAECGVHQHKGRRALTLLASIGGVITVLIALATYVSANVDGIRRTLFWSDAVDVIALHSHDAVRLFNTGDGDLFVRSLVFRVGLGSKKIYLVTRTIAQTAERGKPFAYQLDKKCLGQGPLRQGNFPATAQIGDAEFFGAHLEKELDAQRIKLVFVAKVDPFYERFVPPEVVGWAEGHEPVRLEAVARLTAFSRDRKKEVSLPVTGHAFVFKSTCEKEAAEKS